MRCLIRWAYTRLSQLRALYREIRVGRAPGQPAIERRCQQRLAKGRRPLPCNANHAVETLDGSQSVVGFCDDTRLLSEWGDGELDRLLHIALGESRCSVVR